MIDDEPEVRRKTNNVIPEVSDINQPQSGGEEETILSLLKKKPQTREQLKKVIGWSPQRFNKFIKTCLQEKRIVEGAQKRVTGKDGKAGKRFVIMLFHPELRANVEEGDHGEIFLLPLNYSAPDPLHVVVYIGEWEDRDWFRLYNDTKVFQLDKLTPKKYEVFTINKIECGTPHLFYNIEYPKGHLLFKDPLSEEQISNYKFNIEVKPNICPIIHIQPNKPIETMRLSTSGKEVYIPAFPIKLDFWGTRQIIR